MKQFFDAKNICFSYYRKPLCLKDVHLLLNEKEKVILLAPEEMGKTTFLKVLSSFEDKYFGKIMYKGKDLKTLGDEEKNFSLIFAEPVFIRGSIRKNIDYLSDTLKREKLSVDELQLLLKEFEINKDENVKIKKLSLLEKRKLMLLRAYIKKPDIMFVDDIFDGLEPEKMLKLLKVFNYATENVATIFASGSETFKVIGEKITKINFSKVFYLNNANYYEFKGIDEFLKSKVDFMSLSFREDWQSKLAFLTRECDGYYFSIEELVFYKLDKKFHDKLDALKLDIGDKEDVYFVTNIDFDVLNLENDELNKNLQSGKFSIFAQIDGCRIL